MTANYNYTVVNVKSLPGNLKQRSMEILQDLTGIYIAVLEDTSKACNHCICIDGTRKLIFDSAESTSITLNKINLNVCCGKEGDFLI